MKKDQSLLGGCALVIGAGIIAVLAYLGVSILGFILGALSGWLFMTVVPFFGEWIVSGVALLGIHITPADLPLFIATLGFIGGYFKTINLNK